MVSDFNDMLWDFNAMLWDVYAMRNSNEGLKDIVYYVKVCSDIWTKTPPYKEEFYIFQSKTIRSRN